MLVVRVSHRQLAMTIIATTSPTKQVTTEPNWLCFGVRLFASHFPNQVAKSRKRSRQVSQLQSGGDLCILNNAKALHSGCPSGCVDAR